MIHGVLGVGLAWVFAIWLPGLGIVRRWFRDADLLETLALSLAFGSAVVPFVSFVAAALSQRWLTSGLVLTVAGVVIAAHTDVWVAEIRRLLDAPPGGRQVLRGLRTVVATTLIPLALFALRYSREEFAMTCVNFAPAYATGVPFGDGSLARWDRNDVLRVDTENQEGNATLIGAFPALFRFLGYRLFFANTNLVSFLLALVIGRRIGGRALHGWLLAVLLLFNPLVAGIRETDENLLAMSLVLGTLAVLLRERPSFAVAGALFALAFGCRHILLLGLGGPLVYALGERGRLRSVGAFVVAFAVTSLYSIAHHWLVFGSLLAHESLRHFPEPVAHRFLGIDFQLHTILTWPFTDRVYRSPFNPLPTAVQFATAIPRIFGTVVTALLTTGMVRAWQLDRRRLALLVLIAWPTLILLMVQGNWSELDKTRLFLNSAPGLLVPVVDGIVWLARGPRRAAVCAATLALVLVQIPAWRALLAWRVPVDPREYVGRPDHAVEGPGDEEFMRGLLVQEPGLGFGTSPGEVLRSALGMIGALADTRDEISDPRYEAQTASPGTRFSMLLAPELLPGVHPAHISWLPNPTAREDGETVVIRIRLDRPLAVAGDRWAEIVAPEDVPEGAEVVSLSGTVQELVVPGRTAPAFPDPVDVIGMRMVIRGEERVLVAFRRRPRTASAEPLQGDQLLVAVRREAHVGVVYFANVAPLIQESWDVEPDADGRLRVEPSRN